MEPRSKTRPRNSEPATGAVASPGSSARAMTPQSVMITSVQRTFTVPKVHDPHLTTKPAFATVRIRPMRNFFVKSAGAMLLAVTAVSLGGCDSLKARMIAGDAVNLWKEGKIEEAIAKYQEAAKSDPNIPTIQINIGFANLALYQQNPKGKAAAHAAPAARVAFGNFLKLKPGDERPPRYKEHPFVEGSRYDAPVQYFQPQVQK